MDNPVSYIHMFVLCLLMAHTSTPNLVFNICEKLLKHFDWKNFEQFLAAIVVDQFDAEMMREWTTAHSTKKDTSLPKERGHISVFYYHFMIYVTRFKKIHLNTAYLANK